MSSTIYTRTDLHRRAADYFREIAADQENWKSFRVIEPQLFEFEHRMLAKDTLTAAKLMNELDFQFPPKTSYLFTWGNVQRAKEMRARLVPLLVDEELCWMNFYQLGLAYTRLGEISDAIAAHENALALAESIGVQDKIGATLLYLGLAHFHNSAFEQAIQYYLQALPLNKDTNLEGNTLGHLGNAYAAMGRFEDGIEYLEKAIELNKSQQAKRSEAFWLGRLGDTYIKRAIEYYDKAIELIEQGVEISRDIGDKQIEIYHLISLGDLYSQRSQRSKAVEFFRTAIELAQEIGDRWNEVISAWKLGLLYEDSDPARAMILMSERVAYERENEMPDLAQHENKLKEVENRLQRNH